MRNEGSAFGAAVEMNSKMESAGVDFSEALMALAKEIASKPIDTHTEAEKKFLRSFAFFSILGLLSSKMGGGL